MNSFTALFPGHLKKIFLKITSLSYANIFISIIISVITFRIIGGELFGKYQYFIALIEFPGVFYNSFDRIINRFSSIEVQEGHIKMVTSSLFMHFVFSVLTLLVLLIICKITILTRFLFQIDFSWFEFKILILVFISVTLIGILNTLTTFLNGIREIQLAQSISLKITLLNLVSLIVIYASKLNKTSALATLILAKTVITVIFIILVYLKKKSFFQNVVKTFQSYSQLKSSLTSTMKTYFKDYALHFQINEIFGYFKDRLAILLLGQQGMYVGAAFYEVIKNIISIPRKFFVQMFTIFVPQIIYSYEKNRDYFIKRFRYFCNGQMIITALTAVIILFLNGAIIKLYKFDNLKTHYYLTFFECMTLSLSAWANSNNFTLEIAKDSKTLMYASIGRASIVLLLTPLLISKYQYIGPAMALFISTVLLVLFLSYKTKSYELWNLKNNFINLITFAATSIVLYFTIDISFNFYTKVLDQW